MAAASNLNFEKKLSIIIFRLCTKSGRKMEPRNVKMTHDHMSNERTSGIKVRRSKGL